MAPTPHNVSGRIALQLGVVGVITALIPGIGDFLAAPVAVTAVVLGVVGYLRAEKGKATNPNQAIAGAVLGLLAGFIILASYLIAWSAP
ncbi:MAG TPA: hypothetical protein VK063_07490 [Beutenbergiaceae bacterium]|nr:hypothetical protein [Beutenbergiaceae bacterium]